MVKISFNAPDDEIYCFTAAWLKRIYCKGVIMTSLRYLKNVVTLKLDRETCTGCGVCAEVCPHGVLAVTNNKAEIIDRDACIECGACALNCPVGALTVSPGVGCAAAVLNGMVKGTQPSCGCSDASCC